MQEFRAQQDYHLGGKELGVILGKKVSFSYLKFVKKKVDYYSEVKNIDEVFTQKFLQFYQLVKQ